MVTLACSKREKLRYKMIGCVLIVGVFSSVANGLFHYNASEGCVNVNFYRHGYDRKYHSICLPRRNNSELFERYGFNGEHIPLDLKAFTPLILHEFSVIRHTNIDGKFDYLGNGTFANVYLGEMRESGRPVVIKQFKNDTEFFEIDKEARILMYLEDTGVFPRFYGYLPSGPFVQHISMVIEYLPQSIPIADITTNGEVNVYQWLLIFEQLVVAINRMHKKFVLHNDLHRDNVLVIWNESTPVVRVIDTGHATFRQGSRHSSSGHITDYPFYAPESVYTESNPSMDIYGVGYIMNKSFSDLKNDDLTNLGKFVQQIKPDRRPTAEQILNRIEILKKKYFHLSKNGYRKLKTQSISSSKRFQKYSITPMPILQLEDLSPMPEVDDEKQWLSLDQDYGSYMGTYKGKPAIIRLFANTEFSKIRTEAAVVSYASSKGITPKFHGIFFHGEDMKNAGYVQDFDSGNILLSEAIEAEGMEWSDSYRLDIACRLTTSISIMHQEHILLNNLMADSILYRVNGSHPMITLVNFHSISDSNGQYMDTEDITFHVAPELRKNLLTSFSSDVYMLCLILDKLFKNTTMAQLALTIRHCLDDDKEKRPLLQDIHNLVCHMSVYHDEL